MSVRFLVIPDLHFGAPEQSESDPFRAGALEADWLIGAYKHMPERWPPDVILATGDLTTKVDQVGFTEAKGFFTRLKEEFPDAALFITPGNHDVAAIDSKPRELAPFYPTVQPDDAYKRFFDATSGLLTPPDVVSGEHLTSFLHVIRSDSQSPPVCLMGLNSSRLERPACIGLGYVGVDQFSALLLGGLRAPLRDYYKSARPIFGLAATHFHPLPQSLTAGQQFHEGFPKLYQRLQRCTISFLTDSSQLLGALADARFTVLAHGHSHQPPCARRVFGYSLDPGRPINKVGEIDTPDRESPLHVIDGGHFRPDGTSGLRYFALFDFDWYSEPGIKPNRYANMQARAFAFDVRGGALYGPLELRRESLPLDPLRLDYLSAKGRSGASNGHTLAQKAFRSREFAKCCRGWSSFYAARDSRDLEWQEHLDAIERRVEELAPGRVYPVRSEILRYCLRLNPCAPPPVDQLESLPHEFIAREVLKLSSDPKGT